MNYNEPFEKYEICGNITLLLCNTDRNLGEISNKLRTYFYGEEEKFGAKKIARRKTKFCKTCSSKNNKRNADVYAYNDGDGASSIFYFVVVNHKNSVNEVSKNFLCLANASMSVSSEINILNVLVD